MSNTQSCYVCILGVSYPALYGQQTRMRNLRMALSMIVWRGRIDLVGHMRMVQLVGSKPLDYV